MECIKTIFSGMGVFIGIILIALFIAVFIDSVDDMGFVEKRQPEPPNTRYIMYTGHKVPGSFDAMNFNISVKYMVYKP